MSWEALRLTSRTPAEIYHTIGPNGVDHLIRQALSACWDALPAESRTLAAWEALARDVYGHNMGVWKAIKEPAPANFFQDLRPEPAHGFMRQAMVLCWMMMPRGKRSLPIVTGVIQAIFDRNLAAWEEDNNTFTKGPVRKAKARPAPAKAKPKPVPKKASKAGKPAKTVKAKEAKKRKR